MRWLIRLSLRFTSRDHMFRSVTLFTLGLVVAVARHDPFFRRDYTYVEQFDSFYKLHWNHDGASWESALLACDDEETRLFYPKTTDEWAVVNVLVSAEKYKALASDVLVGIRDEFGTGEFMTVDGLPSPLQYIYRQYLGKPACVTINYNSGYAKTVACNQVNVPFVCKKHALVEICPTVDTAYVYNKDVRKCYKINKRKKTWSNAKQTCFEEGGSLLLIKNSFEAGIVKNMLNFMDRDYFVGFHKLYPSGELYTVKGEKFDDRFYQNWYDNISDCGNIFKTGPIPTLYTQTRSCSNITYYVCEMTPKTYTWSKLANDLTEVPSNQSVGIQNKNYSLLSSYH